MGLKKTVLCLATWVLLVNGLEAKEMCLTFERLPAMKPMGFWLPREISNMILRTLAANSIKAIGFVQEEKIDDNPRSYVVLQDWVEQGHSLGNNTYSYVDLNELSADDFLDHVRDGQKYLRQVHLGQRVNYRYLRFPLLHHGDTKSKKKKVAKVLARADYTVVPATVVSSDFNFNRVFVETEQNSEELAKLKQIYLGHIADSVKYAEEQSEMVFGRQIKQIVRLHAGIATARFLADVLALLKEKGYEFVSLDEALADPAYQAEVEYVVPLGLSFIDRVASTQGLPFDPDRTYLSIPRIETAMAGAPSAK